MQTVFKVIAGAAVQYVRANNAQHARVRAYKVWGMQSPTVQAAGHYGPDIGAAGYRTACSTLDVYKAPSEAPKARTIPKAEGATVSAKGLALAKLLGLAI